MLPYPSHAIKKISMINGDNTIMLPEECYVNDVINYKNHIPSKKYDNMNNEYTRLYVDSVEDFLNCKNKDKITHLTFDNRFNQVIDTVDWKNITHLTFGEDFNQVIDNVDWKNITHLTFSDKFDQIIDNVDWKNITHLTFSYYSKFDQVIDNVDWKNITHLTFGKKFNQVIDN